MKNARLWISVYSDRHYNSECRSSAIEEIEARFYYLDGTQTKRTLIVSMSLSEDSEEPRIWIEAGGGKV